jgi:hypothetical protein
MATFTLGTAANATGMAKSSILRAIKAGRLSATRSDDGAWSIDPVELARVFPLLAIPGATPEQPRIEHDAMADTLVAELRAMLADVKRDRDEWRSAAERASTTLATLAQRQLAPPVEQAATPKRRWWQRRASITT